MHRRFLILAALALAASTASAQDGLRTNIEWRVLDIGKWEVHYPGEAFLPRAREVAGWLLAAQARIEKELDQPLDGPIGVLMYRSRLEGAQHFTEEDNPGNLFPIATDARRRRILIPCLGSDRAMQRTIEFQVAQILIDQRLFSSNTFKASLLDFKTDYHPAWLFRGIASHESGSLLPIEEMLVRDSVLDRELPTLSVLHSIDSLNVHERYSTLVEGTMAVEWIKGGTPRGYAKRLLHVFDSDLPFPTARLIKRACGMSYNDVETGFAKAMEARWRPWAAKEEADRFAHRLTGREQHYRFYELAPAPSPDSRRVAYFEDSAGYFDIVLLDVASGEEEHPLRLKLHLAIDSVHPDLHGVDWSPDGKSICFAGDRLAINLLYIQDLVSGELRTVRLPCEDVMSPQWSPDGKKIVFAGLRHGRLALYLLDVATSDVRRLATEGSIPSEPAWSPDSTSVVFAGESAGQLDLWRIEVASGRLDRLTDSPCDERAPAFRPDGAAITFTGDAGGALNLFSLDFASRTITRHTDLPGGALAPRWTPDGREIVFSLYRHGRFTLWSMPPRTAPAPAAVPDPERAAAAKHFTIGSADDFLLRTYETRIRFESILPTSAKLSDILGYHRIDTNSRYKIRSGGYDFEADITYTNRSLRPDLYITATIATAKDGGGSERGARMEAGISYPIDSDTRAGLSAFIEQRQRTFVTTREDGLSGEKVREEGLRLSAGRANITYRRQNPISGYAVGASVTWWIPPVGSQVNRLNESAAGKLYVELWHDHVLALRVNGTHSSGPDRDRLTLKDGVRGYDSGDPHGTDIAAATAEFRFPIWRDLDWALPAQVLLVKDVRAVVFADLGVISDEENVINMLAYPVRDEWHYSAGFAIQLDMYLLERKYFPIYFTVAKVLDHTAEAPPGLKFEVTFEASF
ncbi:MAG: BamA/TamA family outer membrane protein [Planctomycetes bacterium]|nr:BamA/TamA family outer membrane protein [Planctomycetota bacterium]